MQSHSNQTDLLQPLFLFSEQLKQKSIKKSAIESMYTIAIALGQQKTRNQLIPFIVKQFIKQNAEYRILILKALPDLLPYLGPNHNALSLLEMVFDILCAFSQTDLRNEGFICLQKIIQFIDIKKLQSVIVDTLVLLDKEKETQIKELVIKTIPQIFVQVNQTCQQNLMKILKSYSQAPQTQLLLAKELKNLIKITPPAPQQKIKQLIQTLSKLQDEKIKIHLIDSIILLTKTLGQQTTKPYFENIISKNSSGIYCQLFKKFKDLNEVFSKQTLSSLKDRIINFETQPQEVKNAILEGIENLQLSDEEKKILLAPHSSLQLKYTLGEKLCQIKDFEALGKLIENSDHQFKTKIFPKLPTISQIHVEILETFLIAKNWRVKINILLNVEKRVENDEKGKILLSTLSKYLGDKIGAVRSAIINIMVKIIQKQQINFSQYSKLLQPSLRNQNWFARQSVYILLLRLLKNSQVFQRDNEQIMQFSKIGLKQQISNIRSVVVDILQEIKQKGSLKIREQATILLNGTPRIFY